MTGSLNPEKIFNDYIIQRKTKTETIELLITLLEGTDNEDIIINVLDILDRLEVRTKQIFKILENLLISDENPLVRSAAAKIIVKYFLKEVLSPIEWTIQHEKSSAVLKTLIKSFEKVDNQYTRILKNELLRSIFGVVQEEITFFLELDALIEDYMELNVDFYKDFQTDDISDVIRGRAVYAIKQGHVIGLNLAGWTMSVYSITAGSSAKSHKMIADCINYLPKSVENLKQLQILDLSDCSMLRRLPKTLSNLKELQVLNLRNCLMLRKLPNQIGNLQSLEVLNLGACINISVLPESICNLRNLRELKYNGDWAFMPLSTVPENIGNLQNLENLELVGCKDLISLPESIGELQSLEILDLSYCKNLRSLPESLSNLLSLKKLILTECKAIKSLPESLTRKNSLIIIQ